MKISFNARYYFKNLFFQLPQNLVKVGWRMRALYDLIGGNSSSSHEGNSFVIKAKFPAESNEGELQLNNDKVIIEYDPDIIEYFLMKTRLHKFTDSPIIRSFFSRNLIYLFVASFSFL